jgi:hypothetical protein
MGEALRAHMQGDVARGALHESNHHVVSGDCYPTSPQETGHRPTCAISSREANSERPASRTLAGRSTRVVASAPASIIRSGAASHLLALRLRPIGDGEIGDAVPLLLAAKAICASSACAHESSIEDFSDIGNLIPADNTWTVKTCLALTQHNSWHSAALRSACLALSSSLSRRPSSSHPPATTVTMCSPDLSSD